MIRHGDWQSSFTGDFHAVPTGIVGDLLGIGQSCGGRLLFEAVVDRSGFTAFDILALRDNDRFLAYVLSGADDIRGSSGADYLIGFGGADAISGGGSDDRLFGGIGRDALRGGGGVDFLAGGGGRDVLDGGAGRDTLLGGAGADVFRFGDADASDRDSILDFASGRDRIDLSAIDAEPAGGHQVLDWIGGDAFSGRAGELRFTGGRLAADLDGDRLADAAIHLAGDAALGRTDLIL